VFLFYLGSMSRLVIDCQSSMQGKKNHETAYFAVVGTSSNQFQVLDDFANPRP
jgi:hypothetical protein